MTLESWFFLSQHLGEELCNALPKRTKELLEAVPTDSTTMAASMRQIIRENLKTLVHYLLPNGTTKNQETATHLVQSLSGLGTGTTPTGDDVLTGVLAMGFRLAQSKQLDEAAWQYFMTAVANLPESGTTPTAHAMLQHACEGRFIAPLCDVVSLLATDEPNHLVGAQHFVPLFDALSEIGSYSGTEMLAGAMALAGAAYRPKCPVLGGA